MFQRLGVVRVEDLAEAVRGVVLCAVQLSAGRLSGSLVFGQAALALASDLLPGSQLWHAEDAGSGTAALLRQGESWSRAAAPGRSMRR